MLGLGLRSLWNRRAMAALTVLSIALSVALILGVERLRSEAREGFANSAAGIDLIVAARGNDVQILMGTVFGVGGTGPGIGWDSYEMLADLPETAWAVPIATGDNHRGFPVVGTPPDYFEHMRHSGGRPLAFAAGGPYAAADGAVVGAEIADRFGYAPGMEIVNAHGAGAVAFDVHDEAPFTITGVLARTGTAADRMVFVSLEGFDRLHEDPETAPADPFDLATAGDEPGPADGHDEHGPEDDHQPTDAATHGDDPGHADDHDRQETPVSEADAGPGEDHGREDGHADAEGHGDAPAPADDHGTEDAHHGTEDAHDAGDDHGAEDDHGHDDANGHDDALAEADAPGAEDDHGHDDSNGHDDALAEADAAGAGDDHGAEDDHGHDDANGHDDEFAEADAHGSGDDHGHADDRGHDGGAGHEDDHGHAEAHDHAHGPDRINAVYLGLVDRAAVLSVQRAVTEYPGEPLTAVLPNVALLQLWSITDTAETALRLMAWAVALAGILGMVVMISATLEARRREFAILRSVGATPGRVVGLIVLEALLLTVAGIVLGVVLLTGATLVADPLLAARFGLRLGAGLPSAREWGLAGLVFAAGALAALLPAARVYRMTLSDGLSMRL